MGWLRRPAPTAVLLLALACGCTPVRPWPFVLPEARTIAVRSPDDLAPVPVPPLPPPETVTNRFTDAPETPLALDEAIRIALRNSRVVRQLAGTTAVSTGRTIYDPAITNALVDEAQAAFDPTFFFRNSLDRTEQPGVDLTTAGQIGGIQNPVLPAAAASIEGTRNDTWNLAVGAEKTNIYGGRTTLDLTNAFTRFTPGGFSLNPQDRSALTLGYTQPLLQGGGAAVNLAPIVIARIDTERSFFQLKDAVQELVRGVVEGYWAVVFARVDVWARRQQVEQGQVAHNRAEARRRQGLGNNAEVAQTRSALAGFRQSLLTAEAGLLQREAALRNLLGLSPVSPQRIVPTTHPTTVRFEPKWDEILRLAERMRPDIIELKLVLEADQQQLILAQNTALPRLDGVAQYRWNGLEGEAPTGQFVSSRAGQFTDWSLGVNFSVPLGLRQARAGVRRTELVIARDRAFLEQRLHATVHDLAGNVRNLAQFHEQFRLAQETRAAALENLLQQAADFRAGRGIFLNVLQAIGQWGDAVSSEAAALAQYNSELANLERQTGTILETHGIRFFEERFGAVGPLGPCFAPKEYPKSKFAGPNEPNYPPSDRPSDDAFDLRSPIETPRTPALPGKKEPAVPAKEAGDPLPAPRPVLPPKLEKPSVDELK